MVNKRSFKTMVHAKRGDAILSNSAMLYFLSFSTSCGTTSNKSATNPTSATWKMGASASCVTLESAPHRYKNLPKTHLINSNNELRVLHARKMLDRP